MDNKLLLVTSDGVDAATLKVPGFYTVVNEDVVHYVGSTENLYRRFSEHRFRLSAGNHENKNLQALYNKVETLLFKPVPTDSKERALDIEQAHLNDPDLKQHLCNIAVDARNPAKGITLTQEHKNKLSEAMTGREVSEETRSKMSASRMGLRNGLGHKRTPEHTAALVSANTGRNVSETTRAKLAEASRGNSYALGNKLSDETKNKQSISKGTPVTIDGNTYQSAQFAARQLNLSPQTILNRCESDKFPGWSKNRG